MCRTPLQLNLKLEYNLGTNMISEIEALNIIQFSSLPEGQRLLSLKLAAATKWERLNIIRHDDDVIKRRIAGVIEIQRCYRGYKTRLALEHYDKWPEDKVADSTNLYESSLDDRIEDIMRYTGRQGISKLKAVEREEDSDADLKALYEAYCAALLREGKEPASFETFRASYEQHLGQESSRKKAEQTTGAPDTPQYANVVKIRRREKPPTDHEAAMIVQRAWRRHIDVQVFRYYRDLINFRQKGDPRLMLKCINPAEAALLDSAAGIHIKFRLAGDGFPPNIYYKIFTHRNIVDMCANSPKDYTDASCKRREMKDVHNKRNRRRTAKRQDNNADESGWYSRWENNGWRLVSDRLIQHVTVDPITWQTAQTQIKFHHNKLQRRQDLEKKRRLKKIDWMKQMYKEGMLKTNVTDEVTIQLIEGAAAGMVAAVEQEGPEAVKEWEVDELLEWTTTLSFDDYIDTWQSIATTAKSDAAIGARARLLTSGYDNDPYMLSLVGSLRDQNSLSQPAHRPQASATATQTDTGAVSRT